MWDTGTYGEHRTKKFKLPTTPLEGSSGKKCNTGTYGKHQIEDLKFCVTPAKA